MGFQFGKKFSLKNFIVIHRNHLVKIGKKKNKREGWALNSNFANYSTTGHTHSNKANFTLQTGISKTDSSTTERAFVKDIINNHLTNEYKMYFVQTTVTGPLQMGIVA